MAMAKMSKTERSTALKLRHLMHERVLRLCAVRQIHMEKACQGLPSDASRMSRMVHLHTTTNTTTTTTVTDNNNRRMNLDWRHRLLIAFTPCDDWTWLLKEGADVKDHSVPSRTHPHPHPTTKPTTFSQTHPQNPTQPATSHAVYAMDIEGIKKKRPMRVIQEIESAAGKPIVNQRTQKRS